MMPITTSNSINLKRALTEDEIATLLGVVPA